MTKNEKIKKNITLAPLTTFKIGGPAEFFVEVGTKEELAEAIRWAGENSQPVLVLGGGSNLLVSDRGVNGLVIRLMNLDLEVEGERMECGAGARLSQAVVDANGNDLSGLEWAVGIPGTVGGAIAGNAGANGSSIEDSIENIEVYDMERNKFINFRNKDCKFDYRTSIFKDDHNLVIWKAYFKFANGDAKDIREKTSEYAKLRMKRQPGLPSAGSVFKNIEVKKLLKANPGIAAQAEKEGLGKNGYIGAGWLIDYLGLKGKTIGGAKISLEHANFIVNTGKASADEVVMMISFIKQQVRDKIGIQLQEEIRYFGF